MNFESTLSALIAGLPVVTPVSALSIAAVVFGLIGLLSILAALRALWSARLLGFTVRTLTGLLLLAAGALAGAIALGIQGFQALTHEELIARISVKPVGEQRFEARIVYPDAREQTFQLAGDEIYVDARILKWKGQANLLGLHTLWELDRVAGRYRSIDQEKSDMRTVHSLGETQTVDLFALRKRFAVLAPLFDAEYGSATFVPAAQAAELELFVSTTGLLLRPKG
jgi:hypothetical protein